MNLISSELVVILNVFRRNNRIDGFTAALPKCIEKNVFNII